MANSLRADADHENAIFTNIAQGVAFLVLVGFYFVFDLSIGQFFLIALVVIPLWFVADHFLFGSISRAFAARRKLDYKLLPIIILAPVAYLAMPVSDEARGALALGVAVAGGAIITALLNRRAKGANHAR